VWVSGVTDGFTIGTEAVLGAVDTVDGRLCGASLKMLVSGFGVESSDDDGFDGDAVDDVFVDPVSAPPVLTAVPVGAAVDVVEELGDDVAEVESADVECDAPVELSGEDCDDVPDVEEESVDCVLAVEPLAEPDEDESVPEVDGSAAATPWPVASAAPRPIATAKPANRGAQCSEFISNPLRTGGERFRRSHRPRTYRWKTASRTRQLQRNV